MASKPTIPAVCQYCNGEFLITTSELNRGRKYCSQQCYHKASATGRKRVYVKKYPNGRRVAVTCVHCGVSFETFPRSIKRGQGKYCSWECKVLAQTDPPNAQCEVCGNPIVKRSTDRWERRFCSWECRKVGMRGEGNPNFRNDPDYRGWDWSIHREQALKRDGYCCRHCGATEALVVHHIIPWAQSPDNSLGNLLTLCRSCHSRVHYADGRLNKPSG